MTAMTAIAAAPAAATIPARAHARANADRRAWDAAMARFRIAENESAEIGERRDLIEARFYSDREKIPHITVGPDYFTGRTQPVSTEDISMVASARCIVRELAEGRRVHVPGLPGLAEHNQFCRELAAAAGRRDALIKALDEELGYSKAEAEADAAVDRCCAARDVLLAMPAPDGAALLWKLDWLFFSDHLWADGYIDQTVADARTMFGAAPN